MIWYHFEVWVRAVKTWVSTVLERARSGIQLHISTENMILNIQRVETERNRIWTHVFVKIMFLRGTLLYLWQVVCIRHVYLIATLQGQYHTYAKECVIALENCNKDPHKHNMKFIVCYAFICSQPKSIWYAGKTAKTIWFGYVFHHVLLIREYCLLFIWGGAKKLVDRDPTTLVRSRTTFTGRT